MLQHEREQRIQLEEMVGQLAREQSALEHVSKPSENETTIPGKANNCRFGVRDGGMLLCGNLSNFQLLN